MQTSVRRDTVDLLFFSIKMVPVATYAVTNNLHCVISLRQPAMMNVLSCMEHRHAFKIDSCGFCGAHKFSRDKFKTRLCIFYRAMHFCAKRGIEIGCGLSVSSSVRLSVRLTVLDYSLTLVDQDHIGWKSWKLTIRAVSPTPSLFVTERPSIYSRGTKENWGD